MSRSSECKHKQGKDHKLSHKLYNDRKSSNNNSYLKKKYSIENRGQSSDCCQIERDHNHDDGYNHDRFLYPSGEKTYKSRPKSSIPRHKRRISLPVRVSCIEIFNEEYRDMLSRDPSARLKVVERPDVSSHIKGLTTLVANDPDDIDDIITLGNKNRVLGGTASKPQRLSHAVYTITTGTINLNIKGRKHAEILSHFHFIDLAGSEEQIKFEAKGRLPPKEGGKINLPLSILTSTFSAVSNSAWTKLQYKKSTVVKILRSLIGWNAETDMCAMMEETQDSERTINKSHHTSRKKKTCKNKADRSRRRSQVDKKDALIHRYQKEIEHLHKQLDAADGEEPVDAGEEYSRLQAEEAKISKKLEKLQSMMGDAQLEQKDICAKNQQEMKGFINNLYQLNKELCLQETLIRVYIGDKYKVSWS